MFSGYKYRHAKNWVLIEMENSGQLDTHSRKLMAQIAGSPANVQFGRQLIASRVASNKYAAAAVVFARIVAFERATPKNGIPSDIWRLAAVRSMRNAGAEHGEDEEVADYLIEQQTRDNSLVAPPSFGSSLDILRRKPK